MLVRSKRFACATASITSTMSFGHGPRSSTVSAISSSNLPPHELLVQTNQRIAKLPIRRTAFTAKKIGNVALRRAASLRNFSLRKPTFDEVVDECSPVHDRIITYVIEESKHHCDLFIKDNHAMESLASRLIAKREEMGLSQAELAKKAKLKSQSIIGMLESGARKSSSHIPAIANALGVESLWLSSGTGPERRGSAKAYQLSEAAMNIALLVNEMSEVRQAAILNFLMAEQIASDDQQRLGRLPQKD